MLVVNLFGGPGIGKSTICSDVFSKLKWLNVNCEIVTEYAKDLTWDESLLTRDNSIKVFAEQFHRLYRLRKKVEVVVTDSPLFLSLVYCNCLEVGESTLACFKDLVLSCFKEFKNLNIMIKREKPYNPIGRTGTLYQAEEKDKLCKELLDRYGIPYCEEFGRESVVPIIVDRVLQLLDKQV